MNEFCVMNLLMFARPRHTDISHFPALMCCHVPRACLSGILLVCVSLTFSRPCVAAERTIDGSASGIPEKIDTPPAVPKEFAFTFSMPYGQADEFPWEPEEFDRMLGLLKSAGYNTVHCPYTDWRHELFKKHKMRMMVDVLAWKPPVEADIRDPGQRPKVKEMCEKIKGSDAIWGYNLWNERLDWCGSFENLDAWIRMLRTWDPTHPVWVGTYRYLYSEHFPTNPGVHGWYDYHWARGMGWNFKMLNFYRGIAEKRKGTMGKWLLIHDYNRNLYTLNTSIAHGVKTVLWFIGGPYAPREPDKTKRWGEDNHLVRIGRHMQPLYGLIGEMGLPMAVYSTSTRRTEANLDKVEGMPADTAAFPEDHWLQIKQGEVVCGFFKLPDNSEIVWVANHNAYAWQGVVAAIRQEKDTELIVSMFDRQKHEWVKYGAADDFNFPVPPADACVLRFERVKREGPAIPATSDAEEKAKKWDPSIHFARVAKLLADHKQVVENQGRPYAVYSTPTRRTPDNKDKEAGLPAGAKAFPEDFWMTVKQGEILCGLLKLNDGSDVACLANHNALAWQGALVVPKQEKDNPITMSELHQESGKWVQLGAWNDVNFALPPGGCTVLKFNRAKPEVDK